MSQESDKLWCADLRRRLGDAPGDAVSPKADTADGSLVGIVFSKDRALQLDGMLRSYFRHCKDADGVRLRVLYRATHPAHERRYLKLSDVYRSVQFVPETNFKSDLLNLVAESHAILFVVDDCLFVHDFSILGARRYLETMRQALGFSLRLGRNTEYCYMQDRPTRTPTFTPVDSSVVSFDWTQSEHDFGYPLEVSSSLYRAADILPLFRALVFREPNTLEAGLSARARDFSTRAPLLLCYDRSVAFSAPVNKVQVVFSKNRGGNRTENSPEALGHLFDQGWRLDVGTYDGFVSNACHHEVELRLTRSDASR